MLDISSIYKEISHLKLKNYASPFPTIFLSARDPDEACLMCFDNLIDIILLQDCTIDMRIICKNIKILCKIDKIYILN